MGHFKDQAIQQEQIIQAEYIIKQIDGTTERTTSERKAIEAYNELLAEGQINNVALPTEAIVLCYTNGYSKDIDADLYYTGTDWARF